MAIRRKVCFSNSIFTLEKKLRKTASIFSAHQWRLGRRGCNVSLFFFGKTGGSALFVEPISTLYAGQNSPSNRTLVIVFGFKEAGGVDKVLGHFWESD